MMKSKEWVNSTMGLEGFIASVDSDGTREIEGSPGDLGELGGSRIDSQRGLIDGEEGGDCPGNVLDNQLGLDDEFLRQQSDVRSSVECGDDMCVRCEKDEGLDDGSVGTFGPVVRDGEQGEAGSGLEHLLVLVHGVSGVPECFSVLEKILGNQLPKEEVVLLASRVNSGGSSHDGIEVCGMRLAEEIKRVISENPGLKRISFMAHSIGGLFSRYAAGINYNEANGKIFDLEPWCFISIATPHLGCDVQGESQVPFIGWGLRAPMLDVVMKPIFDLFAAPVTKLMYGQSGVDLFLEDGCPSADPVIVRLVRDVPGEGKFFSALSQFRIRVCYANAVGDALVGWANASIRKKEELPRKQCDDLQYMGVVHESPLAVGCWGDENCIHQVHPMGETAAGQGQINNPAVRSPAEKQAFVSHMLSRLQTLPWCRIDVAIKNTFLTHTNIIVARQAADAIGIPIVEHIAHRFTELSRWILTIA